MEHAQNNTEKRDVFSVDNPFGFSCPLGGTYVSCRGSAPPIMPFFGCCEASGYKPCHERGIITGCEARDVRPMSFDPRAYEYLPSERCLLASAEWYVCQGSNPPFAGCCAGNPCQNGGCPQDYLSGAFLDNSLKVMSSFLHPSFTFTPTIRTIAPTVTSATTTKTETGTGSASTVTQTLVLAPSPSTGGGGAGVPASTIAGITLGVVAIVAFIITSMVYFIRRGNKKRQSGDRDSPALGRSVSIDPLDHQGLYVGKKRNNRFLAGSLRDAVRRMKPMSSSSPGQSPPPLMTEIDAITPAEDPYEATGTPAELPADTPVSPMSSKGISDSPINLGTHGVIPNSAAENSAPTPARPGSCPPISETDNQQGIRWSQPDDLGFGHPGNPCELP